MVFIQNYTVDPHSRRLLVVKASLKLQVRGVGVYLDTLSLNLWKLMVFSLILSGVVRRG